MWIMLAEILSCLGSMAGEALSWGSCGDKVFAGLSCELCDKELDIVKPKTQQG